MPWGLHCLRRLLGETTVQRGVIDRGVQISPLVFISMFRIITGMLILTPFTLSLDLHSGNLRDVGMFRYWTLPNVPLFLLAAPMLTLMIVSGVWGIGIKNTAGTQSIDFDKTLLRKLAFPQLLLAVMAIVTYHVQIITRISSGYMVWYWWVAYKMSAGRAAEEVKGKDWTKFVVRYMVLYGIIQGVLFAGFLPPA